jgi:FKBP-type peptidyl-prolyl cis-trans isomerase 2
MKMWEKKSVTIPTAEAYGEYDVTRTQDVPKEQLESQGITAVEGETIPSMMWALKVLKVTEDTVTVDVNHPLAGKTLNFDLELVDFKD